MRPRSPRLLALGGALFTVGAILLLVWLTGQSRILMGVGLSLVLFSIPSLVVGGRWIRGGPDPLEVRRERRLWTSGPLGRHWLARRKHLP